MNAQKTAFKVPSISFVYQKRLIHLHNKHFQRDHYSVLGVKKDASYAEIKRAYFEKTKLFHPDLFDNEVNNEEKKQRQDAFIKLKQAYDVLKRPSDRKAYDESLRNPYKSPLTQRARHPHDWYSINHQWYHGRQGDYQSYENWRRAGTKLDEKTLNRLIIYMSLSFSIVIVYYAMKLRTIQLYKKRLRSLKDDEEITSTYMRRAGLSEQMNDPIKREEVKRLLKTNIDDAERRYLENLERNSDDKKTQRLLRLRRMRSKSLGHDS